ncbi:MAG: hypothetical protein ACTSWY_09660 [Promethearchaeota archaeon]
MAYYKKVLKETVFAINMCYDKNFLEVNVRRVRKCNNIPGNSRSKINFISRALQDLDKLGYLEFVGRNSPKRYKILHKIEDFNQVSKKMDL